MFCNLFRSEEMDAGCVTMEVSYNFKFLLVVIDNVLHRSCVVQIL